MSKAFCRDQPKVKSPCLFLEACADYLSLLGAAGKDGTSSSCRCTKQHGTGSCLGLVPCRYRYRGLVFSLKSVSQGRGVFGLPRVLGLAAAGNPRPLVSSLSVLLALGPSLGEQFLGCVTARSRGRRGGGQGTGKGVSAALLARLLNPLPRVPAQAPSLQPRTWKLCPPLASRKRQKDYGALEARRRQRGAQTPGGEGCPPARGGGLGVRRPGSRSWRLAAPWFPGRRRLSQAIPAPLRGGERPEERSQGQAGRGPREGGAGSSLPGPHARKCREFARFPGLPSSPSLPSLPSPRLFPPLPGRRLPESFFSLLLFWSWLLAGCAEGLRVLPKAGWGRSSAARPCGAERRPCGRPPGAPSAPGAHPAAPVGCVRARQGRGSGRGPRGSPSDGALPTRIRVSFGHRNCRAVRQTKEATQPVASRRPSASSRPVGRGEGAPPAGEEELAARWVASVLVFPAWLVVKPDTSTLGPDSGGCCVSSRPSWIFRIFENPVAQEEEKEGGRSRSAEECDSGPRPGGWGATRSWEPPLQGFWKGVVPAESVCRLLTLAELIFTSRPTFSPGERGWRHIPLQGPPQEGRRTMDVSPPCSQECARRSDRAVPGPWTLF